MNPINALGFSSAEKSFRFLVNVAFIAVLARLLEPKELGVFAILWSGYQILQSFFGRIETTIFQDLLVNVSLRYDGSSKVGENNTYGLFPAVGVAYKIFEGNDGILNNLNSPLTILNTLLLKFGSTTPLWL